MNQTVVSRLALDVIESADVMLQIAAAHPTHPAESLTITTDHGALEVAEVVIPGSGKSAPFLGREGAGRRRL